MGALLILGLCAALVIAARYPETPLGQALQRWMIEAPARWLSELTFGKVVGWAVFCVALWAMAQALPVELALFGAADASAITEILIATGLLAAHFRTRNLLRRLRIAARVCVQWARSQVRALERQPRGFARAVSRLRPRLAPPSDDDGGAVFA